MRLKVFSMVLAIAAAGGVAGAAPAPTPAPGTKVKPMLHVESLTIDAGEVRPGAVLQGTFIFKNTGDRPVKILKAAPS